LTNLNIECTTLMPCRVSKARIHLKGDERILGDSAFVKGVLAEQEEQFERRYRLQARGYDIKRLVGKVAAIFDIEPDLIFKPGNQPLRVKTRSLVCYWAVRELEMSGTSVGNLLSLGPAGSEPGSCERRKIGSGFEIDFGRIKKGIYS
jgi:REP-associated tyrosine transposase